MQRWDASPLAKQAATHPFFKTEGKATQAPGFLVLLAHPAFTTVVAVCINKRR